MQIVIKNKSIIEAFKKSILEEIDKYLDKYLQELGTGEIKNTIPHKIDFQNIDITSDISFYHMNLESYLTKIVEENHIKNFEFSLIL